MQSARMAAIVTWIYAAASGLPAVPVSMYLMENGRLPSLWGLFDVYAGPWWDSPPDDSWSSQQGDAGRIHQAVNAAQAFSTFPSRLWCGSRITSPVSRSIFRTPANPNGV